MIDQDVRDLLERMAAEEPVPFLEAEPLTRRARRRATRTMVVGALGVAAAIAVLVAGISALRTGSIPAVPPTDDAIAWFEGSWVNTHDDGTTQTMVIRATDEAHVEITMHDDATAVCAGTGSTTTGEGRLEGASAVVIPAPEFSCDEGIAPVVPTGPAFAEQLRNLTFTGDPQAGTLTDSFEAVWHRAGCEPPSINTSRNELPGDAVPPSVQASRNELPRDAVINGLPGTSASPAGIYSWLVGETRWMHRVSRGAAGLELAFTTETISAEDADPASILARFASPAPSDCEATPVRVAGFDGTYRRTGPGREEWILDVNGTTVRILFYAHPGTSDAELVEGHAVIGSIAALPQNDEPAVIVAFRLPRGWDTG